MRAIILAGGKGTRLKPYTTVIPKPLVPVGEKAILEILLLRLKKSGITHVTICLNHLAEIIQAFFGKGEKIGLHIDYSIEETALGTVGPIKLINDLPDYFLVMNGDLLTDMDFRKLMDYHLQTNALITIAGYQRETTIDFGVLEVDQQTMNISGFKEKPTFGFTVSMGVYVMNKEVLQYVPDTPFGFDDLVLSLLAQAIPVKVYPYHGYWLDIGRPEDYEKANEDVNTMNGFV